MSVHPEWGYDTDREDRRRACHRGHCLVKELWDKNITYPFEYSFLDDHFDTLYRSDRQMSAVVSIMAGLAILISCMGLFGLANDHHRAENKEIGIRKVLGATEAQITVLLSKNFTLLIAISFILASPVTYWLPTLWLRDLPIA